LASKTARRVLITGGGGFIGRHLLARLDGDDEFVVIAPSRAEMPCDNADAVDQAVADFAPTVIVHLAASLERNDSASAEQWRHTFEVGRHVLQTAVDYDVQHVIAAGTLDEYGPTGRPGIFRPLSIYGLCKSLVREVASHACRNTALSVDWFRPPVVYGPGQTGEMLIPYIFSAAARGETMRLSDGTQRREFLFVTDLVDWITRCIGSGPDPGFTEHDLHHGATCSVREVVETVVDHFPGTVAAFGGRPRRPGEFQQSYSAVYSSDRELLTDWRPLIGLGDGIAATASWWRLQSL
jgi:UDP-glucose 4-epimerase